jgi:hypothetical protein
MQSRSLHDRVLAARLPVGRDGAVTSLVEVWGGDDTTARSWARARQRLNAHFASDVNARTGVISFSIEGPSPHAAKLMADSALGALNAMVVAIRRQRATSERRFLEARWEQARDSVRAYEAALRGFYERNRVALSPSLQFEETRLRREVDRVSTISGQLATQVEQARIQEVRDTPAVAVIDAPIEPVRKTSPRILVLLFVGLVLGAMTAVLLGLLEAASSASTPSVQRSSHAVA